MSEEKPRRPVQARTARDPDHDFDDALDLGDVQRVNASGSPLIDADLAGGFIAPAARPQTPRWEFAVPDSARVGLNDPRAFVLREISPDDHMLAQRLAERNSARLLYELIKLSLYSVDGRRVNHADDEGTAYLYRWSSKVRQLAGIAYNDIHNTTGEQDQQFLDSKKPVAG